MNNAQGSGRGLAIVLSLCRNDKVSEVVTAILESEWLADHDAEVKADALREAAVEAKRRYDAMQPSPVTGLAKLVLRQFGLWLNVRAASLSAVSVSDTEGDVE